MAGFSQEETEVVDILFRLSRLIADQELRSRVSFNWGFRRRRSALSTDAPENNGNKFAGESKSEAPSPATPLSFPPSESDGKPSPSRKSSKREKWFKNIKELKKQRETLKMAIEKVGRFYGEIVAHNAELKTKQSELANSNHLAMMDRGFGETGIPDLNEPLMADCCEEVAMMASCSRSVSRRMASEARWRRIQIYRAKKSYVSINRLR